MGIRHNHFTRSLSTSYATVVCGYSLTFHSQVVQWVLVYTDYVHENYIHPCTYIILLTTSSNILHTCNWSLLKLLLMLELIDTTHTHPSKYATTM